MLGNLGFEPEYVAARKALLDALTALGTHRRSLILVGAQAIYLHVGEGDLAVSPFTTDADLAIDPGDLGDEPLLSVILEKAKFDPGKQPGTWVTGDAKVDLLVPASRGGGGRRGARLGVHGNSVARKAAGLEGALVDHALHRIGSLVPGDARSFDVRVAGVASLLIAKLHKIAERIESADRLKDKDGLDVLRLLRFCEPAHLAGTLLRLDQHPLCGKVSRDARAFLEELFGHRDARGAQMAAAACVGLEDEMAIRISCEALTRRLLAAWKY